jgi:hypothetical protein
MASKKKGEAVMYAGDIRRRIINEKSEYEYKKIFNEYEKLVAELVKHIDEPAAWKNTTNSQLNKVFEQYKITIDKLKKDSNPSDDLESSYENIYERIKELKKMVVDVRQEMIKEKESRMKSSVRKGGSRRKTRRSRRS